LIRARRLLSLNLIIVLLAPWIAALSGAATSAVPCPMHHSGEMAAHGQAAHMRGGDGINDHHSQHHGTSARGCNCLGECGRSGASFTIQGYEPFPAATRMASEQLMPTERRLSDAAVRLLPPATGPPLRLLS
jgi:hypothetical protein